MGVYGMASMETRTRQKTLRDELLSLLSGDVKSKDGHIQNAQTALAAAMLRTALNGNVRAFEVIRDTIGEKPAESVTISTGNFDALNAAFEGMRIDDDE